VYLSEIDVFQPDIVVVLNENRRILTDDGAEGAPDFVVEILSPKTRKLDLEPKRQVYARVGVRELWIIDPEPQGVLVYRFQEHATEPVLTVTGDGILSSPLFPGLEVDLAKVLRK
jgi:Uma2 family endonuclease